MASGSALSIFFSSILQLSIHFSMTLARSRNTARSTGVHWNTGFSISDSVSGVAATSLPAQVLYSGQPDRARQNLHWISPALRGELGLLLALTRAYSSFRAR